MWAQVNGRGMGGEKKVGWRSASVDARTSADECGWCCCKGMKGNGWVGKIPVDMSKRSCTNHCGRCGGNGTEGNLWGEETSGHERARLRDECGGAGKRKWG